MEAVNRGQVPRELALHDHTVAWARQVEARSRAELAVLFILVLIAVGVVLAVLAALDGERARVVLWSALTLGGLALAAVLPGMTRRRRERARAALLAASPKGTDAT